MLRIVYPPPGERGIVCGTDNILRVGEHREDITSAECVVSKGYKINPRGEHRFRVARAHSVYVSRVFSVCDHHIYIQFASFLPKIVTEVIESFSAHDIAYSKNFHKLYFLFCVLTESFALLGKFGGGYVRDVLEYLAEIRCVGKSNGDCDLLDAIRAGKQDRKSVV